MQVEQVKLQAKEMQFKTQMSIAQMNIQADMHEAQARIAKLRAEVLKIISEVGAQEAEQQLKAFELAIDALQAHNDSMNERLKLMMGGEDGGGKSEGGGVPGLAKSSGDPGVQGASPQLAGGSQSPMGAG
jgi:hypothetical protein